MLHIDLQYFPSVYCINALRKYDKICFNSDRIFRKASFRNRMVLPGSNGVIQLTIPIVGGRGVKQVYKEIQIDHSTHWHRDHFRTIQSIYGKSPWGNQYIDDLNQLYFKREKFLYDWNLLCLNWLTSKFKININIVESSVSVDTADQDFTDLMLPSNYMHDSFYTFNYFQVFEDKIGFKSNMSAIDLLLNEGPASRLKFL